MPQLTLPAADIGLPISREQIERHVDALIDLLDTLDADPDLEPSLGFSNGGYRPEDQPQEGDAFHSYWDAGHDHEDEHDGAEPSEDSEPSLGWTDNLKQGCAAWLANHLGAPDLEEGIGAVRKLRPASKTGGRVLRGCAVLI